jgi:hypothetical protein
MITPRACLAAQDAVESKKRESIMVGLKQHKSQAEALQEALHRAQLELEKLQFALEAKTGACQVPRCRDVCLSSTVAHFSFPDLRQSSIVEQLRCLQRESVCLSGARGARRIALQPGACTACQACLQLGLRNCCAPTLCVGVMLPAANRQKGLPDAAMR